MGSNIRHAIREYGKAAVLWRWRAAVLTGRGQNVSADVWTAMQREEEALDYEATEIVGALTELAAGSTGRRKKVLAGVAGLIAADQTALKAMPLDPRLFSIPPVGGVAGGMKGLLSPLSWAEVGTLFKKLVVGLGVILGAGVVGTAAYVGYRAFLRTPADRAADTAETINAIIASKASSLAACASQPDPEQCREDVNDLYDSLMPGSCGILKTPLGSILGGLVGIGAGYVGMRKLMGWS